MTSRIPRVTLEQWAVLQAVVEEGSFARAAEALNKSQSAVSYALKGMQQQLPVEVLTLKGRKAELTEAGRLLLRRASALLEEARSLERLAATLAQGWEPEVRLAVEAIFPPDLLLETLAEFAPVSGRSRVQVIESVLFGTLGNPAQSTSRSGDHGQDAARLSWRGAAAHRVRCGGQP